MGSSLSKYKLNTEEKEFVRDNVQGMENDADIAVAFEQEIG